jgi:hypothetical protein
LVQNCCRVALAVEVKAPRLEIHDFAQQPLSGRPVTVGFSLADVELLGADLFVEPVAAQRQQALLERLSQRIFVVGQRLRLGLIRAHDAGQCWVV